MCNEILEMTSVLTQLIRSDDCEAEEQEQLNKIYINVAAIVKRTQDAKESRNTYLQSQVHACAGMKFHHMHKPVGCVSAAS